MLQTITTVPQKNKQYYKNSQLHVRPFRITWHGKNFEITNVLDYKTFTENGAKVHVFTATDGRGSFELKFNDVDMAWFLGT